MASVGRRTIPSEDNSRPVPAHSRRPTAITLIARRRGVRRAAGGGGRPRASRRRPWPPPRRRRPGLGATRTRRDRCHGLTGHRHAEGDHHDEPTGEAGAGQLGHGQVRVARSRRRSSARRARRRPMSAPPNSWATSRVSHTASVDASARWSASTREAPIEVSRHPPGLLGRPEGLAGGSGTRRPASRSARGSERPPLVVRTRSSSRRLGHRRRAWSRRAASTERRPTTAQPAATPPATRAAGPPTATSAEDRAEQRWPRRGAPGAAVARLSRAGIGMPGSGTGPQEVDAESGERTPGQAGHGRSPRSARIRLRSTPWVSQAPREAVGHKARPLQRTIES